MTVDLLSKMTANETRFRKGGFPYKKMSDFPDDDLTEERERELKKQGGPHHFNIDYVFYLSYETP
jgi:hypothetical protein